MPARAVRHQRRSGEFVEQCGVDRRRDQFAHIATEARDLFDQLGGDRLVIGIRHQEHRLDGTVALSVMIGHDPNFEVDHAA